jgi:hypothetical protein
MSHTPGEWKVADSEPFVYALNDAGTNRFCAQVQPGWITESRNKANDPRTPDDELRANAHLIAAAPDLLANLKYAVALLNNLPFLRETTQVVKMMAAIAKAEGK